MNKSFPVVVDEDIRDSLSPQENIILRRVLRALRIPWMQGTKLHSDNLLNSDQFEYFGGLIKLHHHFSTGNFDKKKFEFGLRDTINGIAFSARVSPPCELSPPGFPGADMRIRGESFSLKTEGAAAIKADSIHISKWMEMGSYDWSNPENLRDAFLSHSSRYDRVIILRSLHGNKKNVESKNIRHYQLVELPLEDIRTAARGGKFRHPKKTTQDPPPIYLDAYLGGEKVAELYFDGGGEMKLQVRKVPISICTIHAEWIFRLPGPSA